MDEKFLKPYNPNETEDKIYKLWEEGGFFQPKAGPPLEGSSDNVAKVAPFPSPSAPPQGKTLAQETFSIVLPPPNVTGQLHTGHALMLAIEDIMVRFNRMLGKKTLWVPGTDHAAIATQSKVEKIIYKNEGKTRHDIGREEFLKRVNKFAQESHDTIINQTKKMGASLDWSREAFTLDKKRNFAVKTAFKKMYDSELIYRGHRIVNWCPKCLSTLSDDEVNHIPKKAKFYTFKYSKDFPISISTTRPETKLGDTAIAVHPNDKRYKEYIGQEFEIEKFVDGSDLKIKIISDENIDPEFGTGAVGITPAHSHVDYEIAQKNDLPIIKIIDEKGEMTEKAGTEYVGLNVYRARRKVVEKLKKQGLLEKEEQIENNLSICYRCDEPIEPLPSQQWFIDVNKKIILKNPKIKGLKAGDSKSLKEIMKITVEGESIEIIPKRFEKVYYHWINNLRDWCISRQIWYGHQIPVWYKKDKIHVGVEAPEKDGWKQDPDTLDTWFSSGLWTFSTLGWPENTEDLKTFHPTSVLETGYDILFFWVARMILMSGFLLEEVPFEKIYLHGLVRDEKGKKMSKSSNNAVDPLEAIKKYGADALRMSMIVGVGPGNDMIITDEKIKAYKHFANKIWNVSRFVFSNIEMGSKTSQESALLPNKLLLQDEKYLKEFKEIKKEVTKEMGEYKFYLASEKLYHYFWHTFADVIIEDCKNRIKTESAQYTLIKILRESLTMLHPFMPFLTEEIWQSAPWNKKGRMLIVEPWTVEKGRSI